jgi:hypothetical protein
LRAQGSATPLYAPWYIPKCSILATRSVVGIMGRGNINLRSTYFRSSYGGRELETQSRVLLEDYLPSWSTQSLYLARLKLDPSPWYYPSQIPPLRDQQLRRSHIGFWAFPSERPYCLPWW